MSMEEELQKWAEILTALEERRHVAHLHKRAEELTEEAADIQQKLLLATASSARLEFYRPIIGTKPVCPWCWIQEGVQHPMRYLSAGTGVHDIARCTRCNRDCLPDATEQSMGDDGSFWV